MSVVGGWGPDEPTLNWIDPTPGGKRRQQRPALRPDVMEQFLAWREAMMHLVDRCRAATPRLAAAATSELEQVVVPRRRQVGVLSKRWVVEHRVQYGWVLAEWGIAGPPPGVRALHPLPAEPSDRLYLLTDGRIILRRFGPDVPRPIRAVDDADFVQIVHRDGLSDQLRRRLADLFDEAGMAAPFVPSRPSIDHADVWGKVARPGAPPPDNEGPASR
jgi:hypothetical protein